ncbi:DDHD domain-containing protein [Polyplosphaeria fusca]|uniref:DDHD domain-containing protein n=1 Tax=Polyplosphaeria fusca TaxID=682080 RepID=A0A9P4R9R2_9PLEO|nr:DDHD domain-containing protein [Polyplosphaeria fusca]
MANPSATERPTMANTANQYIREVLHTSQAPPNIAVRYFYTSPLAIDDPLSPLPPPLAASSTSRRQPPRPFSEYDNGAISETWLGLRKKILKHNEEYGEKRKSDVPGTPTLAAVARLKRKRGESASSDDAFKTSQGRDIPSTRSPIRTQYSSSHDAVRDYTPDASGEMKRISLSTSLRALGSTDTGDTSPLLGPTTTGTPFIRAPSRSNLAQKRTSVSVEGRTRPQPLGLDSYKWDEDMESALSGGGKSNIYDRRPPKPAGPSAKVPVGVSRLHHVVMDEDSIRMEPIYWAPVNDIATVIRGTWFYKDTMMPVEIEVANMLEAGYLDLQPWTRTWTDELNSAVEVGALGEMKILHKLWPDKPPKVDSRPATSTQMQTGMVQNTLPEAEDDPEQERQDIVEVACDLIDISTGPDGPDNKAAGDMEYGHEGRKNLYRKAGIIYANEKDAYLLRPSLQPSNYYGRRPLANYIRKGRSIGIPVVRGFDQAIWDKLHPPKKTPMAIRAQEGVSTAQAGEHPLRRQRSDPALALSERPQVTDLVLVIHGIGQKLSERMETFHFTHAMNAFRREVNVELGTPSVKRHLRKDMGGIMVLPVNWRLRVSLEDEASGDTRAEDPGTNNFSLKDITPETLPQVRGVISDVMLDIPYYLSPDHNPKMVSACIHEANRIYHLWCLNNPGFSEWGRVHLIAHSLGSVMAIDILSQQPSQVSPEYAAPSFPEDKLPRNHFIFDTKSLFVCGSPSGFFLLLKRASLLPRRDREKPGADAYDYAMPGVAGDQGTYGCVAVDNVYNIINPYDPVAYRLNAAVDTAYSEMLRPGIVPSANTSWFAFANPFRKTADSPDVAVSFKPATARLPSNVELETHNFTREEIAEKRAYLLNDNGQIDYFMKYGGGPLEIQYLTMIGAHSSYWINRDFVRMIVLEVGRGFGKEGTLLAMRAQKKKMRIT